MKKSTAPTGAKCKSMTRDGLRCVLEGSHDVHSSKTKRGGQFSTWQVVNSRTQVSAYDLRGNLMGKWDEDPPKEKPALCPSCGGTECKPNDCLYAMKPTAPHFDEQAKKMFERPAGEAPPKKPTRQKHDDSTIVFNVGDRVRLAAARTSDTGTVLELVLVKGVPRARVLWDSDNMEQFVDTAKLAVVETGMLAAVDRASSAIFNGADGDSGRAAPVKFTDLCLKCGLATHAGKCASSKPMPTAMQAEAVPSELRILGYRRHPVAAVYPLMQLETFEVFADLVQKHGLEDEIELVEVDGETWILDGSNRALACERRNVTPRFKLYRGPTDLEALKLHSALKNGAGRRHLDPSIRAMIASDLAELGQGDRADRQTGQSTGLTQAEAGKKFGVSEKSVRRARVVKTKGTPKVNEAVMRGKLSVEAAEQVTKLSSKEQDVIADEALAKSEGRAVKSGRVRSLVKQQEKRDVVRKINEGRVLPPPLGPFGVIYGDYPWKYDNSDQHEGSRGHMGYPPMELDAIIAHAREMRSRAAKDCIIALWVTNLYIPKIGAVIDAYGAEHHTMLTWPKTRVGTGMWPRGQTEHLVIASIGDPVHTLNEISTLLESFQPQHPGEHSSKPAEVAALLLKHCGGPHLELFGRDPRESWIVWGAESQKFASEAA